MNSISGQNARKLAGALLLVLAFAFSILAVEVVNYRLLVVGDEGLGRANPVFARLLERSTGGEGSGGGEGTGPSGGSEPSEIQLIELLVFVFEDRTGQLREAPGVSVNVTIPEEQFDPFAFGDVLAPEELGRPAPGPVQIMSRQTNDNGVVRFELPAGNYSILATHLGLTGNRSITLREEQDEVTMRWVFYSRFEAPLLVQAYDMNGDGTISMGEPIVLFYQTQVTVKPEQLVILIQSETDFELGLRLVDFIVLSHGVQVILTPTAPVVISLLDSETTLLLGVLWYQVTVSP